MEEHYFSIHLTNYSTAQHTSSSPHWQSLELMYSQYIPLVQNGYFFPKPTLLIGLWAFVFFLVVGRHSTAQHSTIQTLWLHTRDTEREREFCIESVKIRSTPSSAMSAAFIGQERHYIRLKLISGKSCWMAMRETASLMTDWLADWEKRTVRGTKHSHTTYTRRLIK